MKTFKKGGVRVLTQPKGIKNIFVSYRAAGHPDLSVRLGTASLHMMIRCERPTSTGSRSLLQSLFASVLNWI